ncbi:MAG TPA: ATP-binding protein [Candidatus Methylomirabilis sp.]|nr:ATP-binding protein [Candidatus Methylomirabilis sp.]
MSARVAKLLPLNRLGMRLFVLLTLAIASISIAIDAWQLRQEHRRVLAQLQHGVSLIAQAIEGQLVPLLEAADDPRLVGLLEDIRKAKGAECAAVYDLKGRRLRAAFAAGMTDTSPDFCPPVVKPRAEAEAVSTQWEPADTYKLQVLLTPDDRPRAILKLAFRIARLSGPLTELRNSILIERALTLAAIGLILWTGIAFLVTRPIRRLIQGAEAIAQARLGTRIAPTGALEIRELASAFNRMAERLEDSHEQRRKAEERRSLLARQLRRSDKLAALGKLASVIAHEVDTPLTVISGRARILGRGLPEGDPRAADLSIIRDQAARIARTMHQVLEFSRPMPARCEPVNLPAVVQAVTTLLEYEVAARQVQVALQMPPDLPTLCADADQLTQVLLNLLMNAVTATGPGGRVTVRAAPAEREALAGVELTVTDTGAGIRPEDLPHIFDPFFTTKRRGGAGLGLSICRDLVEAHKGTITVESEPGAGSRFTVWLPCDGQEAPHG